MLTVVLRTYRVPADSDHRQDKSCLSTRTQLHEALAVHTGEVAALTTQNR